MKQRTIDRSLTIIGLGYQIGVGKDSVANVLVEKYGFVNMKFANKLKEAVSVIFGWPREKLEDLEFKQTIDPFWDTTPRTILQLVGTEAMRNVIDQQIWVKALKRQIDQSKATRIVISDMRFRNEVDAIKEWGGVAVKVIRPGFSPSTTGTQSRHASETELDSFNGWDYTINNDGTLYDLSCITGFVLRDLELLK